MLIKVRRSKTAYELLLHGKVVGWIEYPYKDQMVEVLVAYGVIKKNEVDKVEFEWWEE